MIEAYRAVLLRSGADPFAVEEATEAWIEMMRFGPDELDPLLILGGTPDLSLKDQEDGGVLAVAFAARANVVVTDNLADFEVGDCETFETSLVRRRDGKTRRLTCQLHERPDGRALIVAHPADFVRWIETGFDISPASVRSAYGRSG